MRTSTRRSSKGDRAVTDEVTAAEGYASSPTRSTPRWRSISDPTRCRPAFVPIVGPTFKWGGDNSDAFYNFAPVTPDVEYRVHGKRGDAVYISVCVYGGPDDGRWSTRIVSNLNDRDIDFDADGSFEIAVSRERPAGAQLARARRRRQRDGHPRLPRRPGARHADALRHRGDPGQRATSAAQRRQGRGEAAVRHELPPRSCSRSPRSPIPRHRTPSPTCGRVPDATYGWAAKDAHYAMGRSTSPPTNGSSITGRSPDRAYWGCMLWNPFMQTFDYRYERIGMNGEQAAYEPTDRGSW